MKLLLSPHNDDEALYCSYTIMREKPLVVIVTDSVRHLKRYGITAEQRRNESIEAMQVLGADIRFLGLPDDAIEASTLKKSLRLLFDTLEPEVIYAPAMQGGNPEHDLISEAVQELWNGHKELYATYTKTNPIPQGRHAVIPSLAEEALKRKALSMYKSQLSINALYFQSVQGRPEYFV